jgi:hypothetical protein
MRKMQILLNKDDILQLAAKRDARMREEDRRKESDLEVRLPRASRRGYLDREDLIAVAEWKWRGARTRILCGENSNDEIKEISAASFAAVSERLRIGSLIALRGVHWPMASVILHFSYPNKYPILDVRAMKTVGCKGPYTFKKWLEYKSLCQDTAKFHQVTMRTLDKALWEASRTGGHGVGINAY